MKKSSRKRLHPEDAITRRRIELKILSTPLPPDRGVAENFSD